MSDIMKKAIEAAKAVLAAEGSAVEAQLALGKIVVEYVDGKHGTLAELQQAIVNGRGMPTFGVEALSRASLSKYGTIARAFPTFKALTSHLGRSTAISTREAYKHAQDVLGKTPRAPKPQKFDPAKRAAQIAKGLTKSQRRALAEALLAL